MSDPLKDFDYFADDACEQAEQLRSPHNFSAIQQRRAVVALLDPEHHAAFYDMCSALQLVGRIEGAQHAVARIRKAGRQELHRARQEVESAAAEAYREARRQGRAAHQELTRKLQEENQQLRNALERQQERNAKLEADLGTRSARAMREGALQLKLARKDALVNRLRREIKDAAIWAEIQAAHADALPEEPPAPEAQWTPPTPPRRRVARDEVLTDTPFGVEVVARQVEEFVRRQGKCSKPDVSAAFPDERALLPTVYRHLHESRKVHVAGWTLTPWPTP